MEYPTNKQVLKAINDSINKKWKKIVAAGGTSDLGIDCALCELDTEIENYFLDYRVEPYYTCSACPLHIFNDGKGCSGGSKYRAWDNAHTKKTAQAMLDELIACRKHFFGE